MQVAVVVKSGQIIRVNQLPGALILAGVAKTKGDLFGEKVQILLRV